MKILISLLIVSQVVIAQLSNLEISQDLLKLTNPDGSMYFINKKLYVDRAQSRADIVIQFDTLTYAMDKYYSWKSSQIEGSYKLCLTDADHNGKKEMYGNYLDPPTQLYDGRISEFNGSSFQNIFAYTDTLAWFTDFGDIENDGLLDAVSSSFYHFNWHHRLMFYTQKNENSLITKTKTIYNRFVSQFNNVSLYDLDKDGELELIYFLLETQPQDSGWMGNHVAKYNKQSGEFELLFRHEPFPEYYTFGFSFGDFDMDGKNNFVTGSSDGQVYIYEYADSNQYRLEFKDSLYTLNAYMSTFTEDLDGNGKPEVWIGSQFFSSVYGSVTRIFALESDRPDLYNQVYQIDIIGLFSFTDGNMRNADIDNDGERELLMYTAAFLFVFKHNLNGYYLDYVITDPKYGTNAYRHGFDLADLDGDDNLELAFLYYANPDSNTIFMKRNNIVNVEDGNYNFLNYHLSQNYPNPFNPSTKIKFNIAHEAFVNLTIFNSLGERITELKNEVIPSGSYEVEFNASNLPSGVYFYTLRAGEFTETKKMILLR